MNLSSGARRLHDLLMWYAKKFKKVFPSVGKLASQIDRCSRTVKRYLAELREAGYLSVTCHGPRGAVYVPDVPDCVPDSKSHPYMSSNSSNRRTAWVIQRKPPEKAQENYILPHRREMAAKWPSMTPQERITFMDSLGAEYAVTRAS